MYILYLCGFKYLDSDRCPQSYPVARFDIFVYSNSPLLHRRRRCRTDYHSFPSTGANEEYTNTSERERERERERRDYFGSSVVAAPAVLLFGVDGFSGIRN